MDFPNGYGNQLVSIEDLRAIHSPKMHPEYAQRLFACLEDSVGLVGIGNGWRSTEQQAASYQRSPNTFAPPGLSFHESHQLRPGSRRTRPSTPSGATAATTKHGTGCATTPDGSGCARSGTSTANRGTRRRTIFPNGVSTWKNNGCPDPGGFNVVGTASLAAVDTGYGLYP